MLGEVSEVEGPGRTEGGDIKRENGGGYVSETRFQSQYVDEVNLTLTDTSFLCFPKAAIKAVCHHIQQKVTQTTPNHVVQN